MNKIYKVIYSKVKQCYIVVSELAKSHVKSSHGSNGQQKAALTMSVLLALGAFTFAFGPTTAEAEDKTDTTGWQFIGVWHKSSDKGNTSENYQSHDLAINNSGATGEHSIAIGVHTQAGPRMIVIGDRLATTSQDSVFIGSGYDANGVRQQAKGGSDVVVIGSSADATGTGSIALGYGATADPWKNVNDAKKTNANKNGNSIALGYKAQAENNNIAIGANSVATAAASTENAKFRDTTATDYKAPTSYVSVGSSTNMRRITNVAAGSDANDAATVGQLEKVAAQKGSWQLTAGGTNASTVDGDHNTVNFSAGSDGNLSVSKTADSNNVTIGLKKDVTLGKATSGNGGSLSIYQYTGDSSKNDKENGYDQLGTHTLLDGSTISVRYNNGTGDSDARGLVLGIANDSYTYTDENKQTKTASSPLGYVYLQDGKSYYYIHGTRHDDPEALQGRLVYNSGTRGYNYIADVDDGIKFTGDIAKTTANETTNAEADANLNPTSKGHTLNISGGVTDSANLSDDSNIGVETTGTTYTDATKTAVKTAGSLSLKLAKDLKGITSISSQTATNSTGGKIAFDAKGTTISGGDVSVSNNKITNLENGVADTDAATVGQMNTAIGKAKTKYYSVKEGPQIAGLSTNENNDGASAWAGLAAGYETGTAGIGSTVVGSYSGVMNEGTSEGTDLRGAASISLGTLNLNQSTNTTAAGDNKKPYSGVANSIIGQGNMTTNSNAAIIIGAGNTIKDSYKDVNIDTSTMKGSTSAELEEALQKAVPESGAQVMAIGGGNKITSAYKTQVVGVGNTVSDTKLNYVDGFNNTVTGGKSNYIIGAKNTLDSGNNNVIFGDNHKLSSKSNNVIIGSADDENKELTASNAVVIGHNADVQKDGGVAIGSDSVASIDKDVAGYDPETGTASTTWKSTDAAVSVGKADGTITRQITGVAAGTNDTDAVNVAQIKKLASINASNIGANLKKADGTAADSTDITNNKKAWATAIGTGTITKDDDGSKQLVTGGTVYTETHPTDGNYIKAADSAATNLTTLDTHVKSNADAITKEVADRTAADTVIDNKIGTTADGNYIKAADSVGTNLGTLDTQVKSNADAITKEVSDRTAADTAIDNKIGTTADGNYIKAADSVGTNLSTLDTQIKANADAINKGVKDLTDTGLTMSDGTKTGVAKLGSTVAVTGDSKNVTTALTQDENGNTTIKVSMSDNPNFTTITTTGDTHIGSNLTVDGTTNLKGDTTIEGNTTFKKNVTMEGDTTVKNLKLEDGTNLNNAVTYDSDAKDTITLKGADGTTITNLKDGALSDTSKDAVTGKQLYTEQQARDAADTTINTKIGTTTDGNYVKAADSIGTNLGTLDTQVKSNADAITKEVSDRTAADTAINTKIGTTADGNYIKAADSVGTNLGTLDTQIKANADAINKGVKDLTDTGLTVSDGTNTGVAKLGSTVAVTGDSKNVSTALTQDANGNTTIKVSMSDNPNFTTVTTTGDTHIGGNLTVDGTTNLKGDTTIEGNTTFKKNVTMEGDTTVKNLKLADGTNLNNAVTYDSNAKDVITLKGADGTTITNLKDGALSDTSKDAVTGKQLYAEQQARDAADTAINTKIGTTTDGNYVKAADSVGTNLGTLDTQVKSNADAITKEVSDRTAADTAINTKIGTTADGNYIKAADSVGTNLGTLDTQVKANADAIGKGVKDLTDKGITMSDGTNTGVAKLGSTVAVTGDSKNVSTALTQDANGNTTLKVSMSDNPNFTTVTTTGDTHIGGNLTVDGTTNLKGDTTIEGDTTFKKNVTMEGDTTVKNLKLEDGTNLNNAVTYDSDAKDAITLKGADGTTITNLKDGALSDTSKDAVTGKQLYAEQQARDAADTAINNKIGTTADGNYVKAADSVGTNLGTLDTQVKTNADAIAKEVKDRTEAITNITKNVNSLSDSAVQYDKDSNKGKVTLAGADGTTITNLKDAELSDTSKDAVTGKQLYAEQQAREAADAAINTKIGTTADGNYVKAADSIGTNLGTLDTQVKTNADAIAKEVKDRTEAITNITKNMTALSDSAVQYDKDSNKGKVTLAGADGTTITNLKDAELSDTSKDAVTGKQLYAEQQAREAADAAINTKIGTTADGNYVKAADSIGTNLGTLDTQVKTNADAITKEVSDRTAADTAINNKIGTIADGNYVKAADSIGTNLGTLDTQVKATHDLINSDGKTIKIGGSDAATKVDVSGKDGQSRVITGVKTDANDSTSAASVGYVNDMNAANTQQIYHDMNSAYSHVENDISRAAAGSNALAALHPMEFDPDDKAQYALGYGHYRNSNAGAVGVFYQPDENSLFSIGASFGNGDAGINAGVTVKFGPGGSGHHALTKTQMAKVINEQSKEIDTLKKENADKDKRIDALEQKVNEILAKVEKDKA